MKKKNIFEVTIVEQIFFIWGNNKVEEMSLCINLN